MIKKYVFANCLLESSINISNKIKFFCNKKKFRFCEKEKKRDSNLASVTTKTTVKGNKKCPYFIAQLLKP